MSTSDPRPLVVGLGNELRRDDGAGLATARSVRERLGAVVEVSELAGEPTQLLDLWAERPLVFAVDATPPAGTPGRIERIEVGTGPLPPGATHSTHGLSLAEAVALGRSLGRMPERLVVYGIEAVDGGHGPGLTPEVARAAADVAQRIEREIRAAGSGPRRTAHA